MHRLKSASLTVATLCLCLSPIIPVRVSPAGAEEAIAPIAPTIAKQSSILAQLEVPQDREREGDRLFQSGIQQQEQGKFKEALAEILHQFQ